MIFLRTLWNNTLYNLSKSIADRILNFERFHDFAARTIEVSCTIKVKGDEEGAEEKLWTQKIRFAECSHRVVEFFWAEVVVENYFHFLASLPSLSKWEAVKDDDVLANDAWSGSYRYANIYNIVRTIKQRVAVLNFFAQKH